MVCTCADKQGNACPRVGLMQRCQPLCRGSHVGLWHISPEAGSGLCARPGTKAVPDSTQTTLGNSSAALKIPLTSAHNPACFNWGAGGPAPRRIPVQAHGPRRGGTHAPHVYVFCEAAGRRWLLRRRAWEQSKNATRNVHTSYHMERAFSN